MKKHAVRVDFDTREQAEAFLSVVNGWLGERIINEIELVIEKNRRSTVRDAENFLKANKK